jgi:hypothetical protein
MTTPPPKPAPTPTTQQPTDADVAQSGHAARKARETMHIKNPRASRWAKNAK